MASEVALICELLRGGHRCEAMAGPERALCEGNSHAKIVSARRKAVPAFEPAKSLKAAEPRRCRLSLEADGVTGKTRQGIVERIKAHGAIG